MKEQQKTVITGGRGFVGVNLIRCLPENRQITIFDNLERSSPTGWLEGDTNMVVGDILDETGLHSAMQDVSHVVHLAAYGSVMESLGDPTTNFDANVRGTNPENGTPSATGTESSTTRHLATAASWWYTTGSTRCALGRLRLMRFARF